MSLLYAEADVRFLRPVFSVVDDQHIRALKCIHCGGLARQKFMLHYGRAIILSPIQSSLQRLVDGAIGLELQYATVNWGPAIFHLCTQDVTNQRETIFVSNMEDNKADLPFPSGFSPLPSPSSLAHGGDQTSSEERQPRQ